MLILSSPSGAGKTTLVRLLSKNRDFHISISHTTRKPRINEIQDEDYHFVDNDKFKNLIKKDEFLEYAKVFNHLYGTTKTMIIRFRGVQFAKRWRFHHRLVHRLRLYDQFQCPVNAD